ncbi:hypothetical protein Rhopal_001869-T1 [Rhodotorula paludigena]|uniref:Dipeptidyl aminopeptidase n=1 Tax=Rhodotorula paludigena TaxID=86838 RepID=A0AAV5GJP7_9BASI|nr:hypothetical protein Rhopal_001869-T1 [Rhodotorula paludigena]
MSRVYAPLSPADAESAPVEPFAQPQSNPAHPRRTQTRVHPPAVVVPDPFAPLGPRYTDRGEDDDDAASSLSGEDDATLWERDADDLADAHGGDKERTKLLDEAALLDPEAQHARGSDDDDDEWVRRPGHGRGATSAQKQHRRRLLGTVVAALVGVVVAATLLARILLPSTGRHTFRGEGLKHITRDELANGTFWSEGVQLEWVAEAGDGVFSQRATDGSIVLTDISANSSRLLVNGDNVRDENGDKLDWARFKPSADMQHVLFDGEWTKVWRHSTLANFHLHTLSSSTTIPLLPPSSPPQTSLAVFSPTTHHLAYVHANDLYVLAAGTWEGGRARDAQAMQRAAVRVTEDGGATVFNGVPDWAYEEEIFSSDSALWWSPSSDYLAFLSFDETDVPEYEYPVYNSDPDQPGGEAYPHKVTMRYPKPGYPNPRVNLRVFSLSAYLSRSAQATSSSRVTPRVRAALYTLAFSSPFPADDVLVTQVAWVGERELVVKATDRIARVERVAYFNLGEVDADGEEEERSVVGRVIRETDWEAVDGGWAEPTQNIVGIASTVSLASSSSALAGASAPIPSYPSGYLDVLPDAAGYNHIAYFSPPDAKEPVWLTSGAWEIDGGIERVDVQRGLVYFIAANPTVARHLYSIPLPSSPADLSALRNGSKRLAEPTKLSLVRGEKERKSKGKEEDAEMANYAVSVSPGGGVYQLNYEGPDVPWQKLFKVDDPNYSLTLANNSRLATLDPQYQHARIVHSVVALPGTQDALGKGTGLVKLNAMEIRPPMMDESGKTKYPVLFQVYGGPNSQTVTTRFQRDWHHYLAVSLGYIVVRVDPRGTGFRGRRFRTTVRGRLGQIEAEDVVAAAEEWAKKPYVDEKRVGIWGWSYGGFLTSKVIETNSTVFGLGMAVAPVTDWRFYDSIYTERYMSTPELNPSGYANASVSRMAGFKHADFALAHGSGDDNVHYQNTANLLDRFTIAQVRNFRFRMFTDSDHSISTRGAYWELMAWLEGFLLERFGEGGRTKSRWKLKVEQAGLTEPERERERERE